MKIILPLALLLAVLLSLIYMVGIPVCQRQRAATSQIVYVTDSGRCYHKGWCDSLSYSKHETTVTQAQADGFRACRRCKPPE